MAPIETLQPVIETTEGCRFCLMCRHVCPITRVTFNEATSPHGWALAISSVRRGLLEWDAETVDLLYKCADCGLCNAFCVTNQPLPEAIVAARAQVVASGRAPAAVAAIEAQLRQGLDEEAAEVAEGAKVVLFAGAADQDGASLGAARRLLGAAGLEHALLGAGRSNGYLAYTLGLHDTARELARAQVQQIEQTGARTLIVLAPEDAHMFRTVYPLLGASLPDGVEVIELTELLARQLDVGRLRLRAAPIELAYHDPCHTPRIAERGRAPRRLLAALTEKPLQEGFWRGKRATPCGASGGLQSTQPGLAADLARAALADATRDGARVVVTDAPGCLAQLRAHAGPGIEVKGLYELVAEGLEA